MSGCTRADDAMHSTGTAAAVPPTHAELLRFLDDFTSSTKAIQAHNVTRLQALLHWWPEFTLHAMLSIFCNLPTTLINTAMTASSNLHHHCEYDGVSEGARHTSGVAMEGHSYSLRQRQAAATVLRHLLRDQLTLTSNDEEVAGEARLFMGNDNVSFLHELLRQLLPMTACFDAQQGTRPVVLCHAASDLIILLLCLALKRVYEATRHVQGSCTKEEDEGTTTTTTSNINSAVWPDFLRTLQTYLVQLLPYVIQQHVTQPGYASHDTPCATSPLVHVTLIRAAQAALLGLARLLHTLCEDKEVRQGIAEEQNTAAQAEGVVRLTELLRHMLHCLSTSLTTCNNTITTPVGVASPAFNTSSAEHYYYNNPTTSNSGSVSECPAGWVEEYLCGLAESVLGACTAYLDDEEDNTLRVIAVSEAKRTQKPRSVALPMSTPSLSAATNDDEEEQRHMPTTTTTTTATEVMSAESQRYTTTTTMNNSVRRFLYGLQDTLIHALLPFTQVCLQAGKHEVAGAVLGAGCEAMRAFLTYVPHDYHHSMASCTQGEQTRSACEVTGNAFMTQDHQCSTLMNDGNAQRRREEEDAERAQAQVTLLQVALPVVLQLWQVSASGSNRVVEAQSSCHTALPRVTSTHTTHAPLQQQQHSTNVDEDEDALVSHPNREKAVQASLLCLTAAVPYLTEEVLTLVMAAWVSTALSALHGLSCLSPRQLARLANLDSNTTSNNNSNDINNRNNDNNIRLSAYTVSDIDGRRAACQAVAQGAVQQQREEEEEEGFPVHVVEGKRGRHGRKAMAAVTHYTLSSGNGLVEEEDNNSEEEEEEVVDECDGLHCLSATQHARRQSVNWLLNALLSNAVLAELTRHTLLQCSYTVLCEASQYILTQAEVTTSDTSSHEYEDIYASHATLEAALMMLNECAEAMLRLSPTTTSTHPASRTLHTNTSSSSEVTRMSSEALLSAITTAVMQLLNTYLQSLTDTTTTTSSKKGCGVLPDHLGVPCVRWLTRLTLTASRVATHSNSTSNSDSPVRALSVALLAAVNGLPSLTSALVTLLQYEQRSAMQVEVIHDVEALMVNYLQHHHSTCGRNEEGGNENDDEGSAQSVGVGSELETESDSDDEEEGEEEDEATRCVTAQSGPLPSSHTLNDQHTTPFTTTTTSSSSETTSLVVLQECLVEMLRCLPRLRPAGRAALYALLAAVVPEWPTSSLLSYTSSSSSATVGPQTTTVSHLPPLLCVLEALATQYNSVVSKTPGSLRAAASRIAEMASLLNCLCEVVPHIMKEEEGRGDIVIQSVLPWLIQVCAREIAQYLFHDIHRANDTNSGGGLMDANAQVSNTATLVQSDAAYTKAGLSREEMCMLAVDLLGACCDALVDRQQLTLKILLHTTTTNTISSSEMRAKALYEAFAATPHGMMCDEVNTQSTPSCALPLWDAVLYIVSSAFGMTPVVLHEGYHQCEVVMPSSQLQQQHAHCPSTCANNVVVRRSMTMEERMQRMDFTTAVVGSGLRRACFSLLYDMVLLRTMFTSSSSSSETTMLVKWMSNVASCCVYELNGDDSNAYSVQTDNRDASVASAAMLCLAEVLHRCCVHGYDVQVILGSDGREHKGGCHRECMRDNNSGASNSRDSRKQLLQQQQHSYYVPYDTVNTPVMRTVDTMSVSLAAMKRYRRLYDILCRRYCTTSEEEKAHTNSTSHSVEVTERRNALLLISALYAFMVYVTEAVTSECNMSHTNTTSSCSEENAWCSVSENDTRVFLHTVVPTARQLFTTDTLNNNNSNDMSSPFIALGNGMDYEGVQVWWNVGFALTHTFHQQQQSHLCNDAHGVPHMMPQDIHSMWNESAVVQQLKQLCLLIYRYGDVGSTTATVSTNLFTLWRPLARHVCAYDEAGGMGWLSPAERAMLSQ